MQNILTGIAKLLAAIKSIYSWLFFIFFIDIDVCGEHGDLGDEAIEFN
jgi:hypothetical protein